MNHLNNPAYQIIAVPVKKSESSYFNPYWMCYQPDTYKLTSSYTMLSLPNSQIKGLRHISGTSKDRIYRITSGICHNRMALIPNNSPKFRIDAKPYKAATTSLWTICRIGMDKKLRFKRISGSAEHFASKELSNCKENYTI